MRGSKGVVGVLVAAILLMGNVAVVALTRLKTPGP